MAGLTKNLNLPSKPRYSVQFYAHQGNSQIKFQESREKPLRALLDAQEIAKSIWEPIQSNAEGFLEEYLLPGKSTLRIYMQRLPPFQEYSDSVFIVEVSSARKDCLDKILRELALT